MKLIINTDGGSRNNPGPAAIGVIIKDQAGRVIKKFSKYLGEKTNNQAEYLAVIEALKIAKTYKAQALDFYLDSQLVVEQLNKNFKIKDKKLSSLFVQIWNLSLNFNKINYYYIPREKNKEADKLVNQCLDGVKNYVD